MTAAALRDLASLLARTAWVRYWTHWNYPQDRPRLMALSVRRWDGQGPDDEDALARDLDRLGFAPRFADGVGWVWVVEQTD